MKRNKGERVGCNETGEALEKEGRKKGCKEKGKDHVKKAEGHRRTEKANGAGLLGTRETVRRKGGEASEQSASALVSAVLENPLYENGR